MSSDNEILALEDKRYAAMCSGDFGALEAMLHDELLYPALPQLTKWPPAPILTKNGSYSRSM
jgi:hypothetical protein